MDSSICVVVSNQFYHDFPRILHSNTSQPSLSTPDFFNILVNGFVLFTQLPVESHTNLRGNRGWTESTIHQKQAAFVNWYIALGQKPEKVKECVSPP